MPSSRQLATGLSIYAIAAIFVLLTIARLFLHIQLPEQSATYVSLQWTMFVAIHNQYPVYDTIYWVMAVALVGCAVYLRKS